MIRNHNTLGEKEEGRRSFGAKGGFGGEEEGLFLATFRIIFKTSGLIKEKVVAAVSTLGTK
jgi:hypothetical protein